MKKQRKIKGNTKMAKEKETKNVVAEVKETLTEAKEKVDNVVGEVTETVKDAAETTVKVVSEVKDKTSETVEKAKNIITTTKGKTWWNRIWSAIVGAIMAVGAMFGITNEQIAEQKAKTEEVKTLANEALEAIKKGDVVNAKAALELAAESGKEVVKESKKIIDNVKNADSKEIKETVKESLKESVSKEVKKETK